MKKFVIGIILLSLCLGAFAQEQGLIKDLYGTVELKPAGTTAFVPAKIGDRLNMNTIISTSFRSSVLVVLGSTIISVRPLTRMTLTEIQKFQETEKLDIKLEVGRVRVNVRPPAGTKVSTTIKAPSATASVRGTEFEIDAHTVRVHEGTVAYSGNDGRVMLIRSGASSQVDPSTGQAADPVEISSTDLTPTPPVGTDQSDRRNNGGSGGVELSFTFEFE
jgi:hypothetical protein